MSFPKKKKYRAGRRERERRERRAERERLAAEAAGQNMPSSDPQRVTATGVAAGSNARTPRQDAQDGPGSRGNGEMAQTTAQGVPAAPNAPQGFQTAMFERLRETRSDARLARRAILNRWRPKPEATEAVLTKATVQALKDDAKIHEVIAVAKLHLAAHQTVVNDEHHCDRMDYHETALELRARDSGIPGGSAGLQMETDGKGSTRVTVYLPNNSRAEPVDELRPEELRLDDG